MMTTKRALSPTRRGIADQVEAGLVSYDAPRWLIDGKEVGGWDGRTLREMRRDGLIATGDDGTVSLTDEAKTLMTDADS